MSDRGGSLGRRERQGTGVAEGSTETVFVEASRPTGWLSGVWTNPRLRGEVLWVLSEKLVSFVLVFVSVKLLTGLMGREVYGEFTLILTAFALLHDILIVPASQSYLRYHHTAEQKGLLRPARLWVMRWYLVVTLTVCGVGLVLTRQFSRWFDLGPWSAAAAGIFFLAGSWRLLGTEVINLKRQRKSFALQSIGFLLACPVFVCLFLICFGVSAGLAVTGQAVAAFLFAALALRPFLKGTFAAPAVSGENEMGRLVWTFGLPYAALLSFQWVQSFADRYIVCGFLGWKDAGLYAAAFQVSGVPFMLLLTLLSSLAIPVAYQRAKDVSDGRQLRSANRVLGAALLLYVLAGGVMVIPYAFWGGRLLHLLTTRDFDLGNSTMAVIAVGRYVQNMALLLQFFYAVQQKMWASMTLRAIGAFAVLPICWITVGSYGLFGAALGSFLGAVLYAVLLVFAPGGVLWLVRGSRVPDRAASAMDEVSP